MKLLKRILNLFRKEKDVSDNSSIFNNEISYCFPDSWTKKQRSLFNHWIIIRSTYYFYQIGSAYIQALNDEEYIQLMTYLNIKIRNEVLEQFNEYL